MQFRTKLGLVDIPNEEVLRASREIMGSAEGTPEIAAPVGAFPPPATGSVSVMDLIAAERKRQIAKGWTPEHDDTHENHEIALVAAVYAMPASCRYPALMQHLCPWTDLRLKDPHTEEDRDRELVKAGALIVAELERRQRARNKTDQPRRTL
jgi:hypothetical protein